MLLGTRHHGFVLATMADITSNNVLHNMKETEKHGHHDHHDEGAHFENGSSRDSNGNGKDIEKTASHGAGYDLSHQPLDEHGEYKVTMKTWAVVVVSMI